MFEVLPLYRSLSAHTEISLGTLALPGVVTLMLVGAMTPSGLHLRSVEEPDRMFPVELKVRSRGDVRTEPRRLGEVLPNIGEIPRP